MKALNMGAVAAVFNILNLNIKTRFIKEQNNMSTNNKTMFDNSNWDSTEFYRGYQAALDDIRHPNTYRCKFQVTFKGQSSGYGYVYAVRKDEDTTYFLIHRYGRWEWRNADEFSPINSGCIRYE